MRVATLILCLAACVAPIVVGAETVPQSQAEVQLSFVPVVRKSAPAVVNIYAQRVVAQRSSPFADDPFFGDPCARPDTQLADRDPS